MNTVSEISHIRNRYAWHTIDIINQYNDVVIEFYSASYLLNASVIKNTLRAY
jgi:CMP-N-acetylneuraminic acid synthetase